MWIMSQDENKLINGQLIYTTKEYLIYASIDDAVNHGVEIGSYNSEKRCKEILNEIKASIEIDDALYEMPKE